MRNWIMLTAVIVLHLCSSVFSEKIDLGTRVDNVAVSVEESTDSRTVLRFDVGSFDQQAVLINNEQYQLIGLEGEGIYTNEGEPSLPHLSRSIIIPDNSHMAIKILSAEYKEFTDIAVAPSKGPLPRTVNPDDIPYTFGDVYKQDGFYPAETAQIREPYILRDFRGLVVDINAIQYNPVQRVLRVYTSVVVEIVEDGPGLINTFDNRKAVANGVEEFENIYKRHFLNYDQVADKYTFLPDRGDMLIITYDSFHSAMLPLVNWKIQKGMRVTMVDISTIGNNTTAIKNLILSYYNNPDYNLAWVLLVGDHAQITSFTEDGGAADPMFVLLAGSDSYPDAFIGRFSAETVAHVETQVERTVDYEQAPAGSDWFHKATGIASSEGAGQGHNGEADYVHMGYIRNDLLSYNYTEVDQLYDPGATSSQVSAALNAGRGFVNYIGHGSTTAWSTTGFSNTNVNNLTNVGKLPFIISVACVNGDFDGTTCFGEAWLRATSGGSPSGAVAAYMSSINQDWVPPMHAQDEATDLLIAEAVTTFGGLCFNGSCKMIDLSGSSGISMYKTWHIFGDPSLQLWSDNPATVSVAHDGVLLIGMTETTVQVPGFENALCAITYNGEILGRGYTNASGFTTISFDGELPVGQAVKLTVTAYNMYPYIADITVITPDGPYIVYDENEIDDYQGNGNGLVDYGETITLGVQLKNVGPDDAIAVTAALSTSDGYVTITDGSESFGDIAGDNGTGYVSDAFTFEVSPTTPDGHTISFELTMTDADDSSWSSGFSLVSHAPVMGYLAVDVDDASGNNNGVFDPGETVNLSVTIQNTGSGDANGVTAVITETDTYVDVVDGDGSYDDIASQSSGENEYDVFSLSADAGCPRGHEVTYEVVVSAANGFSATLEFTMIVGDRVVFFADDFSYDQGWSGLGGSGEWTIGAAVGGTGSDSYGSPDPSLDHSPTADNKVLGNDLTSGTGGDYAGGLSSTYWVTSPVIDCGDFNGCILSMWRWLGVESSTYDHVYVSAYNGTSWVQLFTNSSTIDESSWSEFSYDVSAIADSNANFQIRFGIGSTDGSYNYCGWNIDDISVKGYGERASAIIAIDQSSLADSLVPGDTATQYVRVHNESAENILRVSFASSVSWLHHSTEQQYIAPSDSLDFAVTFATAGMAPGDYSGLLTYVCNDYGHQYDTLEVTLHLYAPEMEVSTEPLAASCGSGETTSSGFTIANVGPGRLTYTLGCQMFDGKSGITAARPQVSADPIGLHEANDKGDAAEAYYGATGKSAGGPDAFGYSWVDSDDPAGPTYAWVDISGVGTAVTLGDDNALGPFPLGFSFPYYDNSYSELYIGSNGVVSFGVGATSRNNQNFPNPTAPNNVIALWWDDLDPAEGGSVYYYYDAVNERFIVSFVEIRNYQSPDGTGSLSFQALLYPNGQIVLQYGLMDPGADADGYTSATIGLENADGSDGLTTVYNAAYMHNNLAISYKAARWMSVLPAGGTIEPYESATIAVNFDAAELVDGEYTGQVTVSSNDPSHPTATIPVSLAVSSYVCGDANGSGDVELGDAVHIVNYVFRAGPAPQPEAAGDANGSGGVDIADAVWIINYIFKGGQAPVCP